MENCTNLSGVSALNDSTAGMALNSILFGLSAESYVYENIMDIGYVLAVYMLVPLCVVGLISNILSFIIILMHGKNCSSVFYALRGLAVADSVVLITWVTYYTLNAIALEAAQDSWIITFRQWSEPLARIAYTTSIWFVIIVASERFIAVCRPFQAKTLCTVRNTRIAMAGVVIFAVIFHVPSWFVYNEVRHQLSPCIPGFSLRFLEETAMAKNAVFKILYDAVLYSLVNILIPLSILLYLNTRLIITIMNAAKKRKVMQGVKPIGHEDSPQIKEKNEDPNMLKRLRKDTKIIIMTVVMIMTFIISQMPMMVLFLWKHIYESLYSDGQFESVPWSWLVLGMSQISSALNSSINFYIYLIFLTQFRTILRNTLCKK